VGEGVLVGVAVGGRGVLVGVKDGCSPGGVAVGLFQAEGRVWVGKITGGEVIVGLNNAVIVRSGVGKTKGVGDATKGKLHARVLNNRNPTAVIMKTRLRLIRSSP
jgi:hypothetical protein